MCTIKHIQQKERLAIKAKPRMKCLRTSRFAIRIKLSKFEIHELPGQSHLSIMERVLSKSNGLQNRSILRSLIDHIVEIFDVSVRSMRPRLQIRTRNGAIDFVFPFGRGE